MWGDSQYRRTCHGHPTCTPSCTAHDVTESSPTPVAGSCWQESCRGQDGLQRSTHTDVAWRLRLASRRCARVCADVRGSEALGPCASSLRGSCSLTQVTFQPFPLPSFSAFPSRSAMLGIRVGGREGGVSHLLRAALTPDTLPHVLCLLPTHPRRCGWGWPCRPVGDLCHVFLWPGCSGWGSGCPQALPHAPGKGLCLPGGRGTRSLVCTNLPCGLVAPPAMRNDSSPIPAL